MPNAETPEASQASSPISGSLGNRHAFGDRDLCGAYHHAADEFSARRAERALWVRFEPVANAFARRFFSDERYALEDREETVSTAMRQFLESVRIRGALPESAPSVCDEASSRRVGSGSKSNSDGPIECPVALLSTFVGSRSLDTLRRIKSRGNRELTSASAEAVAAMAIAPADDSQHVEENAELRQVRLAVSHCLSEFAKTSDKNLRRALVFRQVLRGVDGAHVARQFGISVALVWKDTQRAREAIAPCVAAKLV